MQSYHGRIVRALWPTWIQAQPNSSQSTLHEAAWCFTTMPRGTLGWMGRQNHLSRYDHRLPPCLFACVALSQLHSSSYDSSRNSVSIDSGARCTRTSREVAGSGHRKAKCARRLLRRCDLSILPARLALHNRWPPPPANVALMPPTRHDLMWNQTNWHLFPKRLARHEDPEVRRLFSHYTIAMGEWAATDWSDEYRALMPNAC